MVEGAYEDAIAAATAAAREPGVIEIADVGSSEQATWVIDGYATLFAEVGEQAAFDSILVPVGVGSLAAAAVRFAAERGIHVIGVEPVTAACLTASLAAGVPSSVATPGTSMAGLNCAEISSTAWPTLQAGIKGMVTVSDGDVHHDMRFLAAQGLALGDCGAAPVTALRRLAAESDAADLRAAVRFGPTTRVLLIGTEGPTDPKGYTKRINSNS
jgi:diaminopropionate ammonia-lyase